MPIRLQLAVVSRQQMGRALCSAWLEGQSNPCMISSQFVSMCPRVCAIQFPPYPTQPLAQIDHQVLQRKGDSNLDATGIPIRRTQTLTRLYELNSPALCAIAQIL